MSYNIIFILFSFIFSSLSMEASPIKEQFQDEDSNLVKKFFFLFHQPMKENPLEKQNILYVCPESEESKKWHQKEKILNEANKSELFFNSLDPLFDCFVSYPFISSIDASSSSDKIEVNEKHFRTALLFLGRNLNNERLSSLNYNNKTIHYDFADKTIKEFSTKYSCKFIYTEISLINIEHNAAGGHHYTFSFLNLTQDLSPLLISFSDPKLSEIYFLPENFTPFDVIQKVKIEDVKIKDNNKKFQNLMEKITITTTPHKHTLYWIKGIATNTDNSEKIVFGFHFKSLSGFCDLNNHPSYSDQVKTTKRNNLIDLMNLWMFNECQRRAKND